MQSKSLGILDSKRPQTGSGVCNAFEFKAPLLLVVVVVFFRSAPIDWLGVPIG